MFTSAQNPVLAAFRENVAFSRKSSAELAVHWLGSFVPYWRAWRGGRIARKAHREHAKQVFRHLAALGLPKQP